MFLAELKFVNKISINAELDLNKIEWSFQSGIGIFLNGHKS